MKRRDFNILTGSTLAAVTAARPALAQSAADPRLLSTTLTPLGAERAGNADGSIPAWIGGMVSAPGGVVEIQVFQDEQPIVTIDSSNVVQYQNLLTPGIQAMMSQLGFSIKVFPTHRTAAAPQYVYDNTAKNVTRGQLNPNGGRLGFTGSYGGVPFPIIDTSDPLTGGAQLIWNHLISWGGFCSTSPFSQSVLMVAGQYVLAAGIYSRFIYPYFDPNGSPETFQGYYSKANLFYKAPAAIHGQQQLAWHSANVSENPDITWQLLNGQGRVRKAPDEAYDAPNPYVNGIAAIDESSTFYGNPSEYDWKYLGKREMYVPYHCNAIQFATADKLFGPKFMSPDIVRWEKHRVWVVEATLHPGSRNVLARRRYYLDEDTWYALLGECYDADGNMTKVDIMHNRVVPALPGTIQVGAAVHNIKTEDYCWAGTNFTAGFSGPENFQVLPESLFDAQQLSANASF